MRVASWRRAPRSIGRQVPDSVGIEEPSQHRDDVTQNGGSNCYYDDIEIEADPSILSSVAPSEVRRQWNCRWGLILLLVGAIVLAVPTGVLVSRYYRNSQANAQEASAATSSDASAEESPSPSPQNVTTARFLLTLTFDENSTEELAVMSGTEQAAVEQTLQDHLSTNLEATNVTVSVVNQSLVAANDRRWSRRGRNLGQAPSVVVDLDVTALLPLNSSSFASAAVDLVNSDSTALTASLKEQASYFSDLDQVSAQPESAVASDEGGDGNVGDDGDDGGDDDAAFTVEPTGEPSALGSSDYPSAVPTPTTLDTVEPSVGALPTASVPTVATANPTISATATSGQSCNGLANLCNVPVNQVLFATLHNAHSTIANGFSVAPNHNLSLEDAVQAGYRGINVDIGKCDGQVALTHTYCFLGTRNAMEVFSWLDSWLDDNPNEVLLMPTQIDNEAGGEVTLDDIYQVLLQSGSFLQKLYVRDDATDDGAVVASSSSQDFPTLQQLIDRNQRILFFPYNGQTCADLVAEQGSSSACPTGFYDWFTYAAETQYSFETLADVEDESLSCSITRGDASHAFFGVNVFLDFPSQEAATYLNSAEFLASHLQNCAQTNNEPQVSAVLVDYWDVGEVLKVVSDYNSQLGSV